MIQDLTAEMFASEVKSGKGYVLVDFWAPWCGPCRNFLPIVEKVAQKMEGKVKVVKLNIDENPEIAGEFNITTIPTVILFNDGKPVVTRVGSMMESQFTDWINNAIKS